MSTQSVDLDVLQTELILKFIEDIKIQHFDLLFSFCSAQKFRIKFRLYLI